MDGHGTAQEATAVAFATANLDQRKALDPAFYATECNDTRWQGDRQSLIRQSAAQGVRYPLFGWYTPSAPCVFWHRPQLTMSRPGGHGIPPVLMVQSRRDPATSYEGALRTHRALAGSRLLTVEDGDHGVYAEKPNPCVDAIVEAYLVDGRTPGADLGCPGTPMPSAG